jgi:hypothetical protein
VILRKKHQKEMVSSVSTAPTLSDIATSNRIQPYRDFVFSLLQRSTFPSIGMRHLHIKTALIFPKIPDETHFAPSVARLRQFCCSPEEMCLHEKLCLVEEFAL